VGWPENFGLEPCPNDLAAQLGNAHLTRNIFGQMWALCKARPFQPETRPFMGPVSYKPALAWKVLNEKDSHH